MLKAYHSASVTGLSQTLEEINFEVHERLLRLESPFSEELEQLGVNDNYNELIFLFYTFKDIWVSLFYKTVNIFVGELEKESHAAITSSTNQISATPVDHSMEMEIIKSPNTNHRYLGSCFGSNDSRLTSPSPKEKRNTQKTSKKSNTSDKPQEQITKKSKLTLEKTILTGYSPQNTANVCEIVIYDIPSTMTQLNILTNLGKWG
ncbi:unnamed protein product [Rhizophagus irregularis]|nr:unnamed protein product [Rhizophagus irregularis]